MATKSEWYGAEEPLTYKGWHRDTKKPPTVDYQTPALPWLPEDFFSGDR